MSPPRTTGEKTSARIGLKTGLRQASQSILPKQSDIAQNIIMDAAGSSSGSRFGVFFASALSIIPKEKKQKPEAASFTTATKPAPNLALSMKRFPRPRLLTQSQRRSIQGRSKRSFVLPTAPNETAAPPAPPAASAPAAATPPAAATTAYPKADATAAAAAVAAASAAVAAAAVMATSAAATSVAPTTMTAASAAMTAAAAVADKLHHRGCTVATFFVEDVERCQANV